MSTLTSSSTRREVLAAMADNASYREDNSLAKANAFITACEVWLTCWAFRSSKNADTEMVMPPEIIQTRLSKAESWVASQPAPRPATGGNVVHLSVEGFRRW